MQILIPDPWLREYLETDATPKEIQKALSLCGPSIERLHESDGGFIYDVEVTTNRVDCMSIYGIAREASAILPRFGHTAKLASNPFAAKLSFKTSARADYLKIKIDPGLCPRFSAILIKNVRPGPSPDWLVKKLSSAGMRSLNNIVDISNLLMLELGQPIHTFDYDKIKNSTLVLRESKEGETITTLDDKTHHLPGHDIVIEDGSKKLIDLCGIMGGLNSAIDQTTLNVLLFVQTYEPSHIRKTSMSLAIRTPAAVLFEKGLPTESVLPSMERAIQLFKELTNGIPTSTAIDLLNEKPFSKKINVSSEFINSRLGCRLKESEITSILESLGFTPHVPWWRKYDIEIPEDIIEEIARLYGYHHLPSKLMSGDLPTNRPDDSEFYWVSQIKSALKFWGFTEIYTYSLVAQDQGLKLKNSLSSEWTYLRTNLTASHRQIIQENLGRQPQLNFFEIANIYIPKPKSLPNQALRLIISTTNPDHSRLKGFVESLLHRLLGITNVPVKLTSYPDCLIYEESLNELVQKAKTTPSYVPISAFQPIVEDYNIKLSIPYEDLVTKIKKVSNLINKIEFMDKYEDRITLRITYHHAKKQLTKEDVAPLRSRINNLD